VPNRCQLSRLFSAALLALLSVFSLRSFADFRPDYGSSADICFSSGSGACSVQTGPGGIYDIRSGYADPTSHPTDCKWTSSNPSYPTATYWQRMGSCSVACPTGQIRNSVNGHCEVPTTCNGGTVTSSNSCSCPGLSSNVGGTCTDSPCSSGKYHPTLGAECTWITSCSSGSSLLTTSSSGGVQTSASCAPNVAPDPKGQNCQTYEDMQTSTCKQQASNCTSTGGTFGNVNGQNVCIPAGNTSNPPTCASGSTQFVTNADGSRTPTCLGAWPTGSPTTTTTNAGDDATTAARNGANNTKALADLTASGLAAVVSAINDLNKTTAQGTGACNANNPNYPACLNQQGSGPCDPKAANYAQCIGQLSSAPDSDGSTLKSKVKGDGTGILNGAGTALTDAINNRPNPDDSVDSFKSTILGYLPKPSGCSDIRVQYKSMDWSITCDSTQRMRDWGAYVLAILTLISCYYIALGKE
jgi:hypothetical protein